MAYHKLTSEQCRTILGDLMQRYPRGNNGKLRHYHYVTKKTNGWGDTERLVDPVLNNDHHKLPPQGGDSFLGHSVKDIWAIKSDEYSLRNRLKDMFPDLTQRQLTMRARRCNRRISAVHRCVRKNGRPGMYKVNEAYNSDFTTYVYASSLGEAEQLSEMFLQPATLTGSRLNVRFEDFAGPEDIGAWHAKGRKEASGHVKSIQDRIDKMQAQIESVDAFQRSAEMVSANISAMAAEKSLKGMGK